jgi:protein-S-isoprenylcysteine O-methyltransferase Ste14
MHFLGHKALGITILVLLGLLVLVKRLATGSIIEYPSTGNLWTRLTNYFNLFFLLVLNPGVAILLIAGYYETIDPTNLAINRPQLVIGMEIAGVSLYVAGGLLMAWALLMLQGNYQLGGSAPREADEMVLAGPYRFIRHPMYTAVLCLALGLAGLLQSTALFAVFWIYLALILILIPVEEAGLRQTYHDRYVTYQRKVKKLIPYLY